ncbi:hypothetical protein DFH27DRAFT_609397 [Peziza echinospora]|nr:hypothetical protein DFH27DRAFT_609397 [Peziza echinospora]
MLDRLVMPEPSQGPLQQLQPPPLCRIDAATARHRHRRHQAAGRPAQQPRQQQQHTTLRSRPFSRSTARTSERTNARTHASLTRTHAATAAPRGKEARNKKTRPGRSLSSKPQSYKYHCKFTNHRALQHSNHLTEATTTTTSTITTTTTTITQGLHRPTQCQNILPIYIFPIQPGPSTSYTRPPHLHHRSPKAHLASQNPVIVSLTHLDSESPPPYRKQSHPFHSPIHDPPIHGPQVPPGASLVVHRRINSVIAELGRYFKSQESPLAPGRSTPFELNRTASQEKSHQT